MFENHLFHLAFCGVRSVNVGEDAKQVDPSNDADKGIKANRSQTNHNDNKNEKAAKNWIENGQQQQQQQRHRGSRSVGPKRHKINSQSVKNVLCL